MLLMDSSVWAWLRKEKVRLKTIQQKLPQRKNKEKNIYNERNEQSTQELWDDSRRCNIYIMGTPEKKRERKREHKVTMTENFL